jgi:hypothetical protein
MVAKRKTASRLMNSWRLACQRGVKRTPWQLCAARRLAVCGQRGLEQIAKQFSLV